MPDCETQALIEALEKAEEGGRELDWRCHQVAHPWLADAEYRCDVSSEEPDAIVWKSPKAKPDPSRWYHDVLPHYTTSIDAALTLIGDGYWWEIEQVGGPTGSNKEFFVCTVWRVEQRGEDVERFDFRGIAYTAANALSAASLRAKEAGG